MSLAAKATLLSSIAFTSGIVYWVVQKQNSDLESLHEGVIRDAERQVHDGWIFNLYTISRNMSLICRVLHVELLLEKTEFN